MSYSTVSPAQLKFGKSKAYTRKLIVLNVGKRLMVLAGVYLGESMMEILLWHIIYSSILLEKDRKCDDRKVSSQK